MRKLLFFFISSLFLFANCRKNNENPVPNTEVNFRIYNIEQDPQYSDLRAPYNAIVVTGGYRQNGIIIYRQKINGEIDDFAAYDRTCTNEVKQDCVMEWNKKDDMYGTCSCCGSKYDFLGGFMEKGPAKHPLRQFKCEFIEGDLYVYN